MPSDCYIWQTHYSSSIHPSAVLTCPMQGCKGYTVYNYLSADVLHCKSKIRYINWPKGEMLLMLFVSSETEPFSHSILQATHLTQPDKPPSRELQPRWISHAAEKSDSTLWAPNAQMWCLTEHRGIDATAS